MEDEGVSLFLVATFDRGPNCAAIYEVKLGGGGKSESGPISPMLKLFGSSPHRAYSPVGCDISGHEILLIASYRTAATEHRFIQLQPVIFNTNTKELTYLPDPNAVKSFPQVMAMPGGCFFVLAGGTICAGIKIDLPNFECLEPPYEKWHNSSLPQFPLDEKNSFMTVVGFAIIEDWILISVVDVRSTRITEFYCYQVVGSSSSTKTWQVVEKENEDEFYHCFDGKAEFVGGFVFIFVHDFLLVAYRVVISTEGVIQSLSVPMEFRGLDFVDPPVDCLESFSRCLVHLGGRTFCLVKSGFHVYPSDQQYVSILILHVSDDMKLSKLWSICSLFNIEGLGRANITSLCFDSQRCKYDYNSEFWTSFLKDRSQQCEDLYVDTHMQPVNTEPEGSQPARKRVDSVDSFLQLLGLEKYSHIFEYEEIDMAILVHMTDEDLKSIGLPKGPRKKILLALE